MRVARIAVLAVSLLAGCAAQTTAVVNAASNLPTLGTGMLGTIYGNGIAPEGCIASATSLPLPYDLCGVIVGSGLDGLFPNPVPLIYVSPTQINFYMAPPACVPGFSCGPTYVPYVPSILEIEWHVGDNYHNAVVDVGEPIAAPGIFVALNDCTVFDPGYPATLGACPPSEQVLRGAITDVSWKLISQSNPATINQYLILWGTGITEGYASNNVSLFKPDPLKIGSTLISMPMQDQRVHITFLGPSPQFPGLDQVNFLIGGGVNFPCGRDTKLEVDLGFVLNFSDQQTNRVKLPIVVRAAQAPCT